MAPWNGPNYYYTTAAGGRSPAAARAALPQDLPSLRVRLHGGDARRLSERLARRQPVARSVPRLPLVRRLLLPHLQGGRVRRRLGLPGAGRRPRRRRQEVPAVAALVHADADYHRRSPAARNQLGVSVVC